MNFRTLYSTSVCSGIDICWSIELSSFPHAFVIHSFISQSNICCARKVLCRSLRSTQLTILLLISLFLFQDSFSRIDFAGSLSETPSSRVRHLNPLTHIEEIGILNREFGVIVEEMNKIICLSHCLNYREVFFIVPQGTGLGDWFVFFHLSNLDSS